MPSNSDSSAKAKRRRAAQRRKTAQLFSTKYVDEIAYAVEKREPAIFIGLHGIGKTRGLLATLQEKGYTVVYFSLALLTPQDLAIAVPMEVERNYTRPDGVVEVRTMWELQMLLFGRLADDTKKVIVFDEYSRADRATSQAVMEIIQEGTIGGTEIPGLVTVFALDNPADDDYFVSTGDVAQNTRFGSHIEVTANDIPWREALVRQYTANGMYTEDQLEQVFQAWEGFNDLSIQKIVPPRVLDNMLANAADGVPISWALPIFGSERLRIVDDSSTDVTDKVLSTLATPMGAIADMKYEHTAKVALESAFRRSNPTNPNARRTNIRLVGYHGTGKTAYTKMLIDGIFGDAALIYWSLAQASPEDAGVPVPMTVTDADGNSKQVLEFLLFSRFNEETPKVLVLDEFSRGSRRTKNAVMEIIQEGSLNGRPIKNLVCVVAIDNPAAKAGELLGGVQYDVGQLDPAQATRFSMSLMLDPTDIPWSRYLTDTYGDLAEPFIDWWYTTLDDAARVQCSPRTLEKMMKRFQSGLSIEEALPLVGGERFGPSLENLHASLEGRAVISLAAILKRKDEYIALLASGEETPEVANARNAVTAVLTTLPLEKLEEVREDILDFARVVDHQFRFRSVTSQNNDVSRFWIAIWTSLQQERTAAATK